MEPGNELNRYTRYRVLQDALWGQKSYFSGQVIETYNTEFFDRLPLVFKQLQWFECRRLFPSWTTKEMVGN